MPHDVAHPVTVQRNAPSKPLDAEPIEFCEQARAFLLHTDRSTYAFRVTPHGDLEQLYYGDRLTAQAGLLSSSLSALSLHGLNVLNILDATEMFQCPHGTAPANPEFIPIKGRNSLLLEVSAADDDFKPHTLAVRPHKAGLLRYHAHKIQKGKNWVEPRDHYAQARCEPGDGSATLTVTLRAGSELEVDVVYTVCPTEDVIVRRTEIRNLSAREVISVHKLMSSTLDLEASSQWTLTHLAGAWGREGQRMSAVLQPGKHGFGSSRGLVGHMHQPFAILSEGEQGYSESAGSHYGAMLIYGGNFEVECEMGESGRVRLNLGMSTKDGVAFPLQPGASLSSPECVLAFSSSGVNALSHRFHNFMRNRLLPPEHAKTKPPVLINTWESMYFDMTLPKIRALARDSYSVGVELLVLDDGWFRNRPTDTSGLDDWVVDESKLGPDGLAAVSKILAEEAGEVRKPMKLGLWVEPEMCSPDSNVFREHPDWIIRDPRSDTLHMRRHELYLDLSKTEVQDFVLGNLRRLLSDPKAPVSYMKWDHNRNMYEVPDYAADGTPFAHAYLMGLWRVFGSLRVEFPHVIIESCSAGGGRVDPGTFYFCPQSWASDNTDPVSRARITLGGLSLAYPPRCLGAHVSASPNHQTGRRPTTALQTAVNLVGASGFELNFGNLGKEEIVEMCRSCAIMRDVASGPLYEEGTFWRVWDPLDSRKTQAYGGEVFAYCLSAPDLSSAIVCVGLTDHQAMGRVPPKLRLPEGAIDAGRRYRVLELWPSKFWREISTMQVHESQQPQLRYTNKAAEGVEPTKDSPAESMQMLGSVLMKAGLPVWFLQDGEAIILQLQAVA